MTVDERIQFLLQSTESLHASLQEMTATVQGMTTQVQEHTKIVQEHTKQLQIDAEHIRSLVRIAEIHEQRLSDLENPEG